MLHTSEERPGQLIIKYGTVLTLFRSSEGTTWKLLFVLLAFYRDLDRHDRFCCSRTEKPAFFSRCSKWLASLKRIIISSQLIVTLRRINLLLTSITMHYIYSSATMMIFSVITKMPRAIKICSKKRSIWELYFLLRGSTFSPTPLAEALPHTCPVHLNAVVHR